MVLVLLLDPAIGYLVLLLEHEPMSPDFSLTGTLFTQLTEQ